ncbi:MAG TPA: TspO/MBR family protein [Alphaproteobacteria bacterium]|nr:TspO/MBR family protein [Alphaproteobacteria bacterium]
MVLKTQASRINDLAWLAVSFVLVFTVYGFGRHASVGKVDQWYATLLKPEWAPPNSVLSSVWSVLYALMALAAWLVWRESGWRNGKRALLLYAGQLTFNFLWPILFFGLECPFAAMIDAMVLWAVLLATLLDFRLHSTLATAALVPYLLWVSYAVCLNSTVWRLNA